MVFDNTLESGPIVYRAKPNTPLTDDDANVIGPELDRLYEEGRSTYADIVDDASRLDSLLHPYFEWSNERAGHLYRIDQARRMVRAVEREVVTLGRDGQPVTETIRSHFPIERIVKTQEGTKHTTVIVPFADLEETEIELVMKRAADELQSFTNRNRRWLRILKFERKFGPVFDAIDRVLDGDEAAQ